MDRRRVVITGIGAITPIGHGKDGLWKGASEGVSGAQVISSFDSSKIRTRVAGEISDFNPLDFFDKKLVKRMDRFSQFGLAAASMAIDDAKLDYDQKQPNSRVGVTLGTALGGVGGAELQHKAFLEKGLRGVDPSLALTVFGGAGSSNIAIRYGFIGPSNANSNSCSSGSIGIGEGFRYIRDGSADVMITGGTEAPLFELSFSAFSIIRAMSINPDPDFACRPFDKNRDGFVMGEGAAVLVLEELSKAVKRGANIYCEVLGFSCNNDGYHMVAPRPDALCAINAMKNSLQEAKIDIDSVGYISAHGSSTPLNDKTETYAIKQVFGDRAYKIPISATKSMHTHSLGAAGAIEAAISAMIFTHNFIPPTIHFENVDPDCDLDYVANKGREATVDYILTNSFGFGGINSVLVFGRYIQ